MSETILRDVVNGREVSTIRTDAGGAAPSFGFGGLSSSDFESLTAWPFETMVFNEDQRIGLYHEPYATEKEARAGHERILEQAIAGTLAWGQGVAGPEGNPKLTPEEWETRVK